MLQRSCIFFITITYEILFIYWFILFRFLNLFNLAYKKIFYIRFNRHYWRVYSSCIWIIWYNLSCWCCSVSSLFHSFDTERWKIAIRVFYATTGKKDRVQWGETKEINRPFRRVLTPTNKCSGYDTKLHLMIRL